MSISFCFGKLLNVLHYAMCVLHWMSSSEAIPLYIKFPRDSFLSGLCQGSVYMVCILEMV